MKNKILFFFLAISFLINAQTKISKSHSSQVLNCSTCHSCEIPTKENPCLKACPRESMVRIDQKPEEGPKVLIINKIKETDIYKPVKFSHLAHAEMAEISGGCRTCHHYNPPGNVIGCSECHETQRKREDVSKPDLKGAYHRQCMNCHRAWSGSLDCLFCHQSNEKKEISTASDSKKLAAKRIHPEIKTPAKIVYTTSSTSGKIVTFYHSDHVDLFKYECGDCHKNDNCVKCHNKNKTVSTVKKSLKEIHKKCSNCHNTDAKYSCTSCHSEKEKMPFNHFKRTGFDISKYHSKLACNRCHTTKNKFTGLKSDCSSCHGQWSNENFKHNITGLILDETHRELECSNCHKESTYSKPDCSDCHDDKFYPKDKPGKLTKKL
ncbi:cytochrome c3 family protein [Rosettibacter firmus]|uniref:cytochrome c3 family protein n=1 Tax=Rosettibacter firmus TaxID=3111522 RepID=UPI00336BBAD4